MSSSFGTLFRVSTFGESHGIGVGAVVDGCPPGLALSEADIQIQLDRRRPGQSDLTTPRDEADRVSILSGVEDGITLGTPLGLLVHNRDQRPGDYGEMDRVPRPSHADYTYQLKYGLRASSGGGRASARETIGRVAAGAIAEKILRERWGVEIVAWVDAIGAEQAGAVDAESLNRIEVDANLVRCPDADAAGRMIELVRNVRDAKDSIGGVVCCACRNLPVGWGEPVFDKLEALLAHAMLSLPATKGFEIGSGFAGTRLRGSEHNDPFVVRDGRLRTLTNHAGGSLGGISSGESVLFRVAFKPVATIGLPQQTCDFAGETVQLAAKGRHDPCVVPRAVPIIETMAALVLVDLALRQEARVAARPVGQ
ncbi:MAG: chorismate synthase [Desulfuromonadales bacterium]|nr:chorismate synthase [Desulfuromonadales bacterium]